MTEYVVLLPGDEGRWEGASAEERAAVYGQHQEFARVLAERGHKVTGGAELTHAETAEQLTGFYVVETDDLDDLLQICGILAGADGAPVEVRAAVDHSGSGQE